MGKKNRKYCIGFLSDWIARCLLQDQTQSNRIYVEFIDYIKTTCHGDIVWVVTNSVEKTVDLAVRFLVAKAFLNHLAQTERNIWTPQEIPYKSYDLLYEYHTITQPLNNHLEKIVNYTLKTKYQMDAIKNGDVEAAADELTSLSLMKKCANGRLDLAAFIEKGKSMEVTDLVYIEFFDAANKNISFSVHGPKFQLLSGNIDNPDSCMENLINYLEGFVGGEKSVLGLVTGKPFFHVYALIAMAESAGKRQSLEGYLMSEFVAIKSKNDVISLESSILVV